MSRFFCQDLFALLETEPVANLPEIDLEEPAPILPLPPEEELIDTVDLVCKAGWFRALANRMNVADLLDDIRQSTFLNVWRVRATFDPAFPVVCRIARIGRNVLIDAARARSRRWTLSLHDEEGAQRFDPLDRGSSPVEEAMSRELEARLKELIEAAPEKIEKILALLDQDMTFEQVAAALGQKKAAITSAYHRWKVATLKKLLGE